MEGKTSIVVHVLCVGLLNFITLHSPIPIQCHDCLKQHTSKNPAGVSGQSYSAFEAPSSLLNSNRSFNTAMICSFFLPDVISEAIEDCDLKPRSFSCRSSGRYSESSSKRSYQRKM